jgi:hypothetical protein
LISSPGVIKKGAGGERKKEEEIRKKISTRGKTMESLEWTFSFVINKVRGLVKRQPDQ